jgi:hypothetical protein
MSNEKFTQLPSVSNATLADIIAAVQAGVSVQMTLQQVLALASTDLIKNYAGNPNGNVAGTTFGLCWDTVNHNLWVCTTSGNATTTVWMKSLTFVGGTGITVNQSGATITISTSGSGLSWTEVTGTSQAMAVDSGYIANNVGLVVGLLLKAQDKLLISAAVLRRSVLVEVLHRQINLILFSWFVQRQIISGQHSAVVKAR